MNLTILSTISIFLTFSSILLFLQSSSAFSSKSTKRVFIGTPASKSRRLISDCMTPIKDLLTFSESLTVHDAVHLLLKFGVSGAPVVRDTTGELVGIVSSFDFLQQEAGEGTLLPPIQGTSTKSAVESYLTAAKKICAKKVGDLMTTNIRTMEANQSMRDAASLMSQQKLHRLPIVDDRGKLVGMLTSSDVMIDMVHIVKNLPPGKESIEILKDDTEINDKLQP